jgi:hypothetical protein
MALLSHDDILAVDDRPVEKLPVPEWGGEVMVRGLDGTGRDEYFASMTVIRGTGPNARPVMDTANATAKLVARCIVDEAGEPMFTQQEVAVLGQKSGVALDRVFALAQQMSGLSDEDMAELGKGSTATQNGDSTSA